MQKTDMLNTKKMKRIFLFGLLALLVVSCSSNSDEQEPTSDDEVTITYPKDTSEHELTDFRCQLVSDENGNHWEIKFDREQVNPFMGGGDEEGVSIVVTNMKDEWKALKDETVVVSGKYRALHTKYFHRNQATITYYSFEITQVRKYEPKPTEPKYQVAKITIDVDNNMAVTSKKDYRGCNIKIESDNDEWDYEGRGRIRGRGNSTWEWYPKKPYRLKLDEKASILGLAEEKDWVMLANYRDPTHLMNTFVFEMGNGLGIPYTIHSGETGNKANIETALELHAATDIGAADRYLAIETDDEEYVNQQDYVLDFTRSLFLNFEKYRTDWDWNNATLVELDDGFYTIEYAHSYEGMDPLVLDTAATGEIHIVSGGNDIVLNQKGDLRVWIGIENYKETHNMPEEESDMVRKTTSFITSRFNL